MMRLDAMKANLDSMQVFFSELCDLDAAKSDASVVAPGECSLYEVSQAEFTKFSARMEERFESLSVIFQTLLSASESGKQLDLTLQPFGWRSLACDSVMGAPTTVPSSPWSEPALRLHGGRATRFGSPWSAKI